MLWNYIKSNMLKHPNKKIGIGNINLSYEEMCVFAEYFGAKLTDDYYGIVCTTELASAMAILSCIAAGKTAIPIPTKYGVETYRKILNQADPPSIISDVDGELKVLPFSNILNSHGNDYKKSAVILFTSGSTGTPKGVMLSAENLISNIKSISSYFPICENDTILISRPLCHAAVLTGEFLLALTKGANITFYSESFSPLKIIKIMQEQGVSVYCNTPTLMASLARFAKRKDGLKIRLISISGECIAEGNAQIIREAFPNASIYTGYGLSEASPRVAYLPCEMFDDMPSVAGIPLPNIKVKVVDHKGHEIKRGCVGELIVRGKNVMVGYFRDPGKTAEVIRKGWLYTGDYAYIDKAGYIHIKGRKDDMIIRAGMNIYPKEIENVLSLDSRVEDVKVYGYFDGETQQLGVKIQGRFATTEEVISLCRSTLPSYQIPTRVEILAEIKRTSSGKKA